MDTIINFLVANKATIAAVIGFVLMVVSKGKSNEAAGPIVSKIQAVFDAIAKLLSVLGEILANIFKSDGILGKK